MTFSYCYLRSFRLMADSDAGVIVVVADMPCTHRCRLRRRDSCLKNWNALTHDLVRTYETETKEKKNVSKCFNVFLLLSCNTDLHSVWLLNILLMSDPTVFIPFCFKFSIGSSTEQSIQFEFILFHCSLFYCDQRCRDKKHNWNEINNFLGHFFDISRLITGRQNNIVGRSFSSRFGFQTQTRKRRKWRKNCSADCRRNETVIRSF